MILALVALGIMLFIMWRSIRRMEVAIAALVIVKNTPAEQTPQRTSTSGGELWDQIRNSAENLTIQMQLK